MSEHAITRRQSLGILAGLAAVPFIGRAVRVPQDTFEIGFHNLSEKVVIRGYADGHVDVDWKEPWDVSEPTQSGWRIAGGPDESFVCFRYKPEINTLELDYVSLRERLV